MRLTMVSGAAIINIVVYLVIVGLIFYLLFWAIGAIGLPEPFSKVATALIVLVAVIYLIGLLTGSVPTLKLL